MSNQSEAPGVDAGFELVITDAASKQVGILAEKHSLDPDIAGLRVGAYEGGCSGYMYDVRMEQRPDDDDRVLEINGIRVFVSEFSMPLVNGMKVDWVSSITESRFVFSNPNATGECGCGVSFST